MYKLLFFLLSVMLLVQCSREQKIYVSRTKPAEVSEESFLDAGGGLKYAVLARGNGPQPKAGQTATLHYSVWSTAGQLYDSSLKRGKPYQFVLGKGQVIGGWEKAVFQMRVGDAWQLIVPPELAYGDRGAGGVIPPNATLVFELQLLDVQ